jgi:hypothetical protein
MLMTVPQSQELRACGAQVRIYIDGADLTRWCFAADDVHGWALLQVAPSGRPLSRLHQGRIVPDAMIVLGDVSFGYDLRPDTSVEAM